MDILLTIFIVSITLILSKFLFKKSNCEEGSYKKIPIVGGGLPFIGHGHLISKDILGFVRNSYNKYGSIFQIKIFNKNTVVVCDRSLIKEYFSAKEEEMSLYDALAGLNFVDGFSDDPHSGSLNMRIIKKIIGSDVNKFMPKIMAQAQNMISRFKTQGKQNIKLSTEMIKFVSCTSAICFIGIELSDELFDYLMKFTHLQNKIIGYTYFIPRYVLNMTFNQVLRYYRKKISNLLEENINSYRNNPTKNDSLVFRMLVDYVDEITGKPLTNTQISNTIICLLYVSSENTSLGLTAVLTDLILNPKYWNMIKEESHKHLENNDIKSLFASKILDSVVTETARMNTHMFSLIRKPKNKLLLGDYYLGNIDVVAVCAPMMMTFDCAEDKYRDCSTYNPERFLSDNPESTSSTDFLTFGSGSHLCPGKKFALYEIKAGISLMTTNFELPEIVKFGELNYFSPAVFAERPVEIILTPISN